MILYRLTEDLGGIPEGACVSLSVFNSVYYLDRPLFEPVSEFEKKDFIEYKDEDFCNSLGIECLLFYTEIELQKFIDKNVENGIAG